MAWVATPLCSTRNNRVMARPPSGDWNTHSCSAAAQRRTPNVTCGSLNSATASGAALSAGFKRGLEGTAGKPDEPATSTFAPCGAAVDKSAGTPDEPATSGAVVSATSYTL